MQKKKEPCNRDNFGEGSMSNLLKSVELKKHTNEKLDKGLFATELIKKGEIVWDDPIPHSEANLIAMSDVDKMSEEQKEWVAHYCYQISETHFRAPNNEFDAATYTNHSCNGNLGFVEDGTRFVALRDIQPGEELTFDYATSEIRDNGFVDCLCGASNCRKVLTIDDWKLPEVQNAYKGHFMPFIQDLIDKSNVLSNNQ